MIPEEYREFFVGAAGASGALIGLLFVAISVAPERAFQEETRLAFRTWSSAALLVFSNALVLSLAALVPGVDLGWWSLGTCLGMFVFACATLRAGVTEARRRPGTPRHIGLVTTLLVIVGFEVYAGVRLVHNASDLGAVRTLNYLVIADLMMGIARAWQLASMRDTGLFTSLRVLAQGEDLPAAPPPTVPTAPSAPDSGDAPGSQES
jgi:hypothetical protein